MHHLELGRGAFNKNSGATGAELNASAESPGILFSVIQ
jgi:hypothetical protein